MRALHPTAWTPGGGRSALRALLWACAGVAALLLTALVSDGEAPELTGIEVVGATDPDQPLTQSRKVTDGALATGVSQSPLVQLQRHLVSSRGRSGFASDAQAVLRALRARQDALSATLASRIRFSEALVADGHPADRPTILTRPLRGPPARGG